MNFALLSRPRTQAILDRKVNFAGLPIAWHSLTAPLNWVPAPEQTGAGMLAGGFDGGEMSIASFVQARSRGAPLLALPVFLKRGLVQRSLFRTIDAPLRFPEQLQGRRVGLVGYGSSMAIWMRGVLAEEYHVPRSSVAWFAVTSSSQTTKISPTVLEIPPDFTAEDVIAWEELDGYPHKLDRKECFVLSLLESGQLDAAVSFHAKIVSAKVAPLVKTEDELWLHYQRTGIYPVNHIFVLRKELLLRFPHLVDALLAGFREARNDWMRYFRDGDRRAMEKEIERLGWDPFAYRLTEVERKTLEAFITYLAEENLISEKLSCDELFCAAK